MISKKMLTSMCVVFFFIYSLPTNLYASARTRFVGEGAITRATEWLNETREKHHFFNNAAIVAVSVLSGGEVQLWSPKFDIKKTLPLTTDNFDPAFLAQLDKACESAKKETHNIYEQRARIDPRYDVYSRITADGYSPFFSEFNNDIAAIDAACAAYNSTHART
ncbi:hypothetical protein AGMMS49531_01540 [Endomicrobiia bacterium]|nr:hypothetical protein AGMMS49531_01540 [Endomicrobiia bacterium]